MQCAFPWCNGQEFAHCLQIQWTASFYCHALCMCSAGVLHVHDSDWLTRPHASTLDLKRVAWIANSKLVNFAKRKTTKTKHFFVSFRCRMSQQAGAFSQIYSWQSAPFNPKFALVLLISLVRTTPPVSGGQHGGWRRLILEPFHWQHINQTPFPRIPTPGRQAALLGAWVFCLTPLIKLI